MWTRGRLECSHLPSPLSLFSPLFLSTYSPSLTHTYTYLTSSETVGMVNSSSSSHQTPMEHLEVGLGKAPLWDQCNLMWGFRSSTQAGYTATLGQHCNTRERWTLTFKLKVHRFKYHRVNCSLVLKLQPICPQRSRHFRNEPGGWI